MDRTGEYFAGPARQRIHLLPRDFSATVRLDLSRPDGMTRWYLTVSEHSISVWPGGEREADCVLSSDGAVFDRLVAGGDITTATLRNEVTYIGSQRALIYFERLLPGPPGSRGPERVSVGRAGRHHVEGGQNDAV
ncbi:SCP2 sterol-binding domain-containing protein [Micromonospora sp. NBC_01699]|uniref:SCP2 sterol-binding domain-containing protein n=1 Tax=Micromonospora sp. NBC_01699 TaxID=2975984 RepID=UPI002E2DBB3F|nr:SCP2 sterol-binding domain-containing protein [Micromonospora sp. NBC_01699]